MTKLKTEKSLEKQLVKAEQAANDFKLRAKQIKDKIKVKRISEFAAAVEQVGFNSPTDLIEFFLLHDVEVKAFLNSKKMDIAGKNKIVVEK